MPVMRTYSTSAALTNLVILLTVTTAEASQTVTLLIEFHCVLLYVVIYDSFSLHMIVFHRRSVNQAVARSPKDARAHVFCYKMSEITRLLQR